MEIDDEYAAAARLSERFKRSLVNRLAQRMAAAHYRDAQAQMQAMLDQAEMRGRDAQLLVEWQQQLQSRDAGANACIR